MAVVGAVLCTNQFSNVGRSEVRIWRVTTESGIELELFVARVRVVDAADQKRFESELRADNRELRPVHMLPSSFDGPALF